MAATTMAITEAVATNVVGKGTVCSSSGDGVGS